MISAVTVRSASAMRQARSTRWRICAGHHGHLHVLVRDVLEQALEVDLLLVVAAHAGPRLLADDRQHRLVVELGVVEPVQEMNRAGARGRQADAELAGELGVRAGHERRHLLVADLDELRAGRTLVSVARAPEGAQDPVDPVARIAVDALDAPRGEALQEEVANRLAHAVSFLSSSARLTFPLPGLLPALTGSRPLGYTRSPASSQGHGGVDVGQMGQSLREVAEQLAGLRVRPPRRTAQGRCRGPPPGRTRSAPLRARPPAARHSASQNEQHRNAPSSPSSPSSRR